jgi:hypothetical protein
MNVDELLHEVQALDVRIEREGETLRFRPASRLTPEIRERLRQHKAELLDRLAETVPDPPPPPSPTSTGDPLLDSMHRLEAMHAQIAVNPTGDLRMVLDEGEAAEAIRDGYVLYSPEDAYMYVTRMSSRERRLFHGFKVEFGTRTERWDR